MPVTSVFHYAGIHARVRALYSTLLSPQEITDLVNTPSFRAVIDLLSHTVYGSYLMGVEERNLTPRRAAYQIELQLAKDYDTIIRSAPEYICPYITQFYRSFEVDNLKAIFRGIYTHSSWDRVRYVLFPLGSRTVLPAQAMLEGNMAAAVELLRGTPYYATLSYAIERYNLEQSLFPLEVALDLDYWRKFWDDIHRLQGLDREQAVCIIGSLLDMNNLMWAIRYRIYYNLSEEEIINYTLPFGYRVKDEDIRAIAAGAEIPQIIERIYPDLIGVASLLMDPRKGLPALEVLLQRQVAKDCRSAFMGFPFHIGIPLAYMVLKKMEIQDLIVIFEAKSSQIPSEKFRSLLLLTEPSAD